MMRVNGVQFLAVLALVAVGLLGWTPAAKTQELQQIELTDQIMERFIAVQKDLAPVAEQLQKDDGAIDAKIEAQLEAIAKKHGFADFTEFEVVAGSINIVLAGLDPETDTFTDPHQAMNQELAEIQADTSMKADEKKRLIEEIRAELEATPPLKFPGNVEVVKRYRDRLDTTVQ